MFALDGRVTEKTGYIPFSNDHAILEIHLAGHVIYVVSHVTHIALP